MSLVLPSPGHQLTSPAGVGTHVCASAERLGAKVASKVRPLKTKIGKGEDQLQDKDVAQAAHSL